MNIKLFFEITNDFFHLMYSHFEEDVDEETIEEEKIDEEKGMNEYGDDECYCNACSISRQILYFIEPRISQFMKNLYDKNN
jgi:hypothetical protein